MPLAVRSSGKAPSVLILVSTSNPSLSGRSVSVKYLIVCKRPSSSSERSSFERLLMISPRLFRTVASRLTTFTVAENVGFEAGEFAGVAELLLSPAFCAAATCSQKAQVRQTKAAEDRFDRNEGLKKRQKPSIARFSLD